MTPLVLVGGGLANALVAARLSALRRDPFLILEAGASLGGNHTWSFHETDVPAAALEWLGALGARRLAGGHDVMLPGLSRTLAGSYWSLRSEDLHRALERLPVRYRARAVEVGATHVVLDGGERLEAGAVLDGRGQAPGWPCGWQKFLGLDLELEAPHGLQRPLLMDATVEQLDGFRFVYALPWSPTRVLVEDTIYSGERGLELDAARARIMAWAAARGWRVARVEREEHAALPIPLGGEAPRLERPVLGVAAGLFHATTGYSLPWAVRVAELIATSPSLDAVALTRLLDAEARRHFAGQRFFRLLNRMLFLAAEPRERVRIFSSFYRHDEALIGRFYAGELGFGDVLRVLARGSRTLPAGRAMRAAMAKLGDGPQLRAKTAP